MSQENCANTEVSKEDQSEREETSQEAKGREYFKKGVVNRVDRSWQF